MLIFVVIKEHCPNDRTSTTHNSEIIILVMGDNSRNNTVRLIVDNLYTEDSVYPG